MQRRRETVKQRFYKISIFTILITLFISSFINAFAEPPIYAQSYIAMDAKSGRILCSNNADKKLPMASTTKIMTTILAIENLNDTNKIIEIPESCTNIEGSSLYLKPKQKVSIKDLLYGTMLRSGNDAATVLAYKAGKNNVENFINKMNEKAKEIGAYNTNFSNPSGLHDENHYTTAYDLALISKYALENELFSEIASAKLYKANSLNTVLYNKNKVVHQYEYGNGIKIGYTKAAGRCLAASAKKDDTEIIVVVLNDNSWFQDSYNIFDWAFENYKSYNIVDEGQFISETSNGEPVFALEKFSYVLTEKEKSEIKFVSNITEPIKSSGNDNIEFGTYQIYLKDKVIFTGHIVGEK
jgi:D-alanyl-D-alanine carboxypeptidase